MSEFADRFEVDEESGAFVLTADGCAKRWDKRPKQERFQTPWEETVATPGLFALKYYKSEGLRENDEDEPEPGPVTVCTRAEHPELWEDE